MSSEEDFTDEELIEEPAVHSNRVSSTAISLGKCDIAANKDVVQSRGLTSSAAEVQLRSVHLSDSSPIEEQIIPSAKNFASSAVPVTKIAIPTEIPSTSVLSTSVPSTSTGNDAFMRFLAERKEEKFSSDEFSSDEQSSDNSLDGFEDPNDNSKVKRDLQVLQAYLSQDDSSCDESHSVEPVSVIGAIPHLASPYVNLDDGNTLSTVKLIEESLKQNKACIERLEKAKDAAEKRLAAIRARFTTVTNEISEAIKVKNSNGWMLNLCFTSPYFRDERGFPPPNNADHELKLARREIMEPKLLKEQTWLVRDSQFICNEVRKWEIEGILMKKEQDRNAIRRKIAQCEDDEEKSALTDQLYAEEDLDTENLTLEEVVGSRKDGKPDWLAMSVNKLGVDRSAETIQAVWENYLDPRLPKGGWSDEEDYRLREIAAEHGEEDWPAIAEELGTGRTGFTCFMRFKAAVDRDFIGTRFNSQEDGFVRRSVAATTFNHQVSWSQTEFLYRGRRDKRSLKMRWRRLEAEANSDLRKGKFTEDEDLAILRTAHELGTRDFAAIARAAFGNERTGPQVQMRYRRLTTETKRGQWTLEEDILLVRLVSQMGRNWHKVREAFGMHRTKEQLRFRHESVAKHVSERLTATHQTLDQVLDEMAASVRVNTRVQNPNTLNLLHRTRITDMNEEELRDRQESRVRKRRTYYVRKRASAEMDDLFLRFFAVSYNPPEYHEPPTEPATPQELGEALSMLLVLLGVDFPLPDKDMLDPIIDDPVLMPAITYLRSKNGNPGNTASNSASQEPNSATNLTSSDVRQTTMNPVVQEPNSSANLDSFNTTPVALEQAISSSDLNSSNLRQASTKSNTSLINSNDRQTALNPANQGLYNHSKGLSSSTISRSQSSVYSTSASVSQEQSVDPLALDINVKIEVDDDCPIEYPQSNFDVKKRKNSTPMVSIPSLEVMKNSAHEVRLVTEMETMEQATSVSGKVATRRSTRGSRLVPLNKMAEAIENAIAVDNANEPHVLEIRILENEKTATEDPKSSKNQEILVATAVKNSCKNQPVGKVAKASCKKGPVTKVAKTQGKKHPVPKITEQVQEKAVASEETALKRPFRTYSKFSKQSSAVTNPPVADKPAEAPVCIDLELPVATVASKANVVSLSSLLPLEPDVTPLQRRAAAKAFTDKIEIVSNGKKILLTKVAAPPPGVKVTKTQAKPTAITSLSANPTAVTEPPANPTPVSVLPEVVTSSNTSASSCTPEPSPKKSKTAAESRTEINPWTGLPVIPPSAFKLKGEKCYGRRRIPITIESVDPGCDSATPVLPPGLVSMIGIRTLIGSMNSLRSLGPVKLPQEDGAVVRSVESRRAARLWESRIFSLFSFPALLARNPLLRRPQVVPAQVADMERQFPPIGDSRPLGGRRSYSRKRPRND